jgi:CheY-like chemotaxis protein
MSHRVLIVDDEFGFADVIAEVLSEAGFDAAIAINGQVALLSMAEKRPDVVLLDMMMPLMDGPALLAAMRADAAYATIPVVMMTSLPEMLPASADAALYQAVLDKPFTEADLLDVLRRLLDSERGSPGGSP